MLKKLIAALYPFAYLPDKDGNLIQTPSNSKEWEDFWEDKKEWRVGEKR